MSVFLYCGGLYFLLVMMNDGRWPRYLLQEPPVHEVSRHHTSYVTVN